MQKLGSTSSRTAQHHVVPTCVDMFVRGSNLHYVGAVSTQKERMRHSAIILPMCEKDNHLQTNSNVSNRSKSPMQAHPMMSLHSKLEAKQEVCFHFLGRNRKSRKVTVVEEHQSLRMHTSLEKI